MFTSGQALDAEVLSAGSVAAVCDRLLCCGLPADEGGLEDLLRSLQEAASVLAARVGDVALGLEAVVLAREEARGVREEARGQGVARQVGLALRCSPHAAKRQLTVAHTLSEQMPATSAALRSGVLTWDRARQITEATSVLPEVQRREADCELCGDPASLEGVGTRALAGRARAITARLDPAAVVERNRRAAAGRYVSLRPLPDGMSRLTAVMPLVQGVACYSTLVKAWETSNTETREPFGGGVGVGEQGSEAAPQRREWKQARGPHEREAFEGEGERPCEPTPAQAATRTKGQYMTDALYEYITGQNTTAPIPAVINLIMSDETLLGAGSTPAELADHHGVVHDIIPAPVARQIAAAASLGVNTAWMRRLYANPTGDLIAATSKQRFYTGGLKDWITIRDKGRCRTPYCDAPARQVDHIQPAHAGGQTTLANGQALCQACNLTKETHDWTAAITTEPNERHTVVTVTPTGRKTTSTAPPPFVPAA